MPTPAPGLVRDVWHYLRRYRKRLALSCGLLVFSVPLVNFHPLVWGIVADHLAEGTLTIDLLVLWITAMIATYLVGLGSGALHTYLLEKTGQGLVRDLRIALFHKFQRQSLSYHHDHHSGELVTRAVSDVDAMEQSVLQGISGLLEEIVTFVVVAGYVLWISPVVGAASILPLALAFIFIRIYNRRVKAIYEGVRKRLGHIGSFLQDRLGGVQVSQIFGRGDAEEAAFAEKADAFYERSVAASRLRNTYFPIVSTFGFINNVAMLGVGAYLIMNGSGLFTIGGLIAYRGFWWRLQSPIRTIAQTSDILQRARAAAARVFEILNAPIDIADSPGAIPLPMPARGAIRFEDLSFHYREGTPILRGVTFDIAPGEFVAVAGGSGSGKSTVLNLIPRFYDATSGSLTFDGHDVRSVTLESLREPIGLVGQESTLFDGTVRENLLYGSPEAGEAALEAAARSANAHDFIVGLPEGYDTLVGQSGVKLSGGQRQRINLARALLGRPRVLLLDEPTASVEPESEALIHESILRRTASAEGSTVLVTHRIALLRQAPRILFLEAGRIAGDGSHADLLARCPAYSDAYHRWETEETLVPGTP